MRRPVAALEQLRARLNVVIADLERGDEDEAAEQLEQMETEFRSTMKGLHP